MNEEWSEHQERCRSIERESWDITNYSSNLLDKNTKKLWESLLKSIRLSKLSNKDLVMECLHSEVSDYDIVMEMMDRLYPNWVDEPV